MLKRRVIAVCYVINVLALTEIHIYPERFGFRGNILWVFLAHDSIHATRARYKRVVFPVPPSADYQLIVIGQDLGKKAEIIDVVS